MEEKVPSIAMLFNKYDNTLLGEAILYPHKAAQVVVAALLSIESKVVVDEWFSHTNNHGQTVFHLAAAHLTCSMRYVDICFSAFVRSFSVNKTRCW